MTIRSLRQRDHAARAAAYLVSLGLVTVPVVRCRSCGVDMPADHSCPRRQVS